ncbi:oxygen-independent coproporphyrinogen III oxidase [Agrobacterium vitis]|uniref:oxygen-independent coproporphyrinogen III oxidase n=1 Tax=Rhizobium/Agrobacterium group TaxID=227290 RepID=UPI000871C396|nr:MULTISPECIES: oxygen-independent coproporphyrinogen III oxidase [Rhizobium/Agrobacterium group]MCF1449313.1 oxygen-independent coproporphyrinogen III oxidase [Allorhizobium ampelinum]MCF1464170.1 oxygen-independent coproporphyrinogen III oxidase [Allorhizobium ampelinum]MCF1484843.1 oxygen-independent coproporphyrinogen III oxidase [Allorhizobium ampelinum]MUO71971.1 oxygen-independent coproporphyrinogen III oxidase [Agrobacterium vitis]
MKTAILEKYGEARLPRYTSYPTAPRFSPEIDASTYAEWLSATLADAGASLYLHIPFCRSMCWYCGCHTTISQKDQPILDYLDMLRAEIRLVSVTADKKLAIDHVHFGGGTPTIMQPQEFFGLMGLLREHFTFSDHSEIAVEIDPRTLTAEMAMALGDSGVRRASLGVQSFDPVVQKAINRVQSVEQTADAVTNLRAAGTQNINFDLIYGLPHQTEASCIDTAEQAIALRPDRFAVFGYAHIPSFKKHQKMIDETALADSRGRDEQAEAIASTLISAGYRRIGLDHYALAHDDMVRALDDGTLRRNFQGYTTDACETLVGLGASAIGRTHQGYVQNEVTPGGYARRIGSGNLATVKGYRLTAEDRLRAAIIERLMCDFAVDVPLLCEGHGFDAGRLLSDNAGLAMLEDDGIIDIDDGRIQVRQEQRFVIRAVAACFDAYLDQSGRTHSRAA